jgi:tRNA(Ser,Leu) C12 N-acetylase TAN1
MKDWNIVVTVREDGYARARHLMDEFGLTEKTHYYDVMVMHVPDVREFLETVHEHFREQPERFECLGHVSPCTELFSFQSPDEFDEKAAEAARRIAPALAGKRFHVRMHRRGFKGQLHSGDEERLLDGTILGALKETGAEGEITFDDPDAIVVVETVDCQAGLGVWTREELARYPLIRLD